MNKFFPLLLAAGFAANAACVWSATPQLRNLGPDAAPSSSFVSGHESIEALNDGIDPSAGTGSDHPHYGNWPEKGLQWVEYTWPQPVSTGKVDVLWWDDRQGVRLPKSCRLLYWDGAGFVPVPKVSGLGVGGGKFQTTTFDVVTTPRLRLEIEGDGGFSTGILEWKVYDSGDSPQFPPIVRAGPDRSVVTGSKTFLSGSVRNGDGRFQWTKESGPGDAVFDDPSQIETQAAFSVPGEYVLRLTASGASESSDTLHVTVAAPAPEAPLEPVFTKPYKLDSPLWNARAKALITEWIPHCVRKLSEPGLAEGGVENFVQAANKLAGRPSVPHAGSPWADAYTLNTFEAICMALMVDAGGDAGIVAAQEGLRKTMDAWVPILLAAQEPDGYLQTRFTLGTEKEKDRAPARWTMRGEHEGYVAGYFIEAAIAHYLLTGEMLMLDAAIRLADCWDRNLGPSPKKPWFDGHQEIEQALVRLARVLDQKNGPGSGARYVALAKFLLDQRGGGGSYDQSHLPVTRQYEALGHAVRAVYTYSAIEDVAMETGDRDYQSAALSLWSNLVNKKYYITGGVGSGETPEGFGGNYSLRHNAYCESCSSCGMLFFQQKMNMAYGDARYADIAETTLFNAILGSVDLAGKNFTYTNELDGNEPRYPWHGCPCCIGNIPRTLLMLPEWMYARGPDSLYVNQFIGSTVRVGNVAGTNVEVVQKTGYPWKGEVALTLNPDKPKKFSVHIRSPQRDVSVLYRGEPAADGITSVAVNGVPVTPEIERGYAVITREWKPGDRIDLVLPLAVQRVASSEKVLANRDRTALRFGPLVYNIESVDQKIDSVLPAGAPLSAAWKPDLLDGVVAIGGRFADGSELTAIPNYARLNRGGRSIVWIKDK